MAEIKTERAEIIFRILYVGPETAQKVAILQSLHDHLPAEITDPVSVLVAGNDRIISFRHRPAGVKADGALDVALDACAIPGKIADTGALRLLLRSADAIVFVADESSDGAESQTAYDRLVMLLESVGRKAADLPLWMHMPTAAGTAKWARQPRGEWHPLIHTVGDGAEDAADVFLSCGRSVIEHFDERARVAALAERTAAEKKRIAVPERAGAATTFEEWERSSAAGRVLTSRTARELQMLEPAPKKRRGRFGGWGTLIALVVLIAGILAWWIAKRL